MHGRATAFRRAIVAAILLVFAGARWGRTQESAVTPQPEADAFTTPTADTRAQTLIVLIDGRVLQGNLDSRPGGYSLQVGSGSIMVPFGQVRLTASSLSDAYQKLREGLVRPTAADHVALARWCCDQQLYESARRELADALRLEPQRQEARSLLVEIAKRQATGVVPASAMSSPRPAT